MAAKTKTASVVDLPDEEVVEEATSLVARRHGGGDLLAVIEQAVVSKADVETLRELLAMRREERADQAREAYAQAMVNFRAKCPTIKQTGERNDGPGRTRYKYAVLPQAVEQIQPLMTECGLAATWTTPTQSPQWIEVACTVTHILGHSESTKLGGPPDTSGSKNQLQSIKSTWSYLRRVTLFSLLGLVDKDTFDDDGMGGRTGSEPPKPQAQADMQNGAAAVKQEFVKVCRKKARDPKMSMANIKAVYEAIVCRLGVDDAQACLDFVSQSEVSVHSDGTFIVPGDAPPESLAPPWNEDDQPKPLAYKCGKCKTTMMFKPHDGKCPSCTSTDIEPL